MQRVFCLAGAADPRQAYETAALRARLAKDPVGLNRLPGRGSLWVLNRPGAVMLRQVDPPGHASDTESLIPGKVGVAAERPADVLRQPHDGKGALGRQVAMVVVTGAGRISKDEPHVGLGGARGHV